MLNISAYSNRQYIHGWYVDNPSALDTLVIKTKYRDIDGNIVSDLVYLQSPTRNIYITKPELRNHTYKKFYAPLSEVDTFTVPEREVLYTIYKELHPDAYIRNLSYRKAREVLKSPYVYMADIPIEVIYKNAFMSQYTKAGNKPIEYDIGFLDIETSMIPEIYYHMPNLITVTHNNHIYTGILECFLSKGNGNFYIKSEIMEHVNKTLGQYKEKHNLVFHVEIFNDMELLIRWIFDNINKNKTDFIGIWNIAFDIPTILNTLEAIGVDDKDVICPKEIPDYLKFVTYKQDNNKNAKHPAEKWHKFNYAGYTKFIDSMCLYSRLRTAEGKKDYKLETILNKEMGFGKLPIPDQAGHLEMQKYRFLDYIAYNMFDAISLYLMEQKNKDITRMNLLLGTSEVDEFAGANALNRDDQADYLLSQKNAVLGTASGSLKNDYYARIGKAGGLVLKPENAIDLWFNALLEAPDIETAIIVYSNDFDFKAYYPKTEIAKGISPEVKLASIIGINGVETLSTVEACIDTSISTKENAVYMGKKYFNLLGYEKMFKEVADILTPLDRNKEQ